MTKVLITGATGHAGATLAEHILTNTDWQVISLERLSRTNHDRLVGLESTFDGRLQRVYHDFRAPLPEQLLSELGTVDYIVHNGAEVHAIRSLTNPELFVQANTLGVFHLLEAARALRPKKFIYTSSAEVFGPAHLPEAHSEDSALHPSNPYAASKAAGEMLVHSYVKTFDVPAIIGRSMNFFGERQQVSKFIPMVLRKALAGEPVHIHVGPAGQAGTRQWIYIWDYVAALLFLLKNGTVGEAYNIAGLIRDNYEIIRGVASHANLRIDIHPVDVSIHHKAHDLHYRISDKKMQQLGWKRSWAFDAALKQTVEWTLANREWLEE